MSAQPGGLVSKSPVHENTHAQNPYPSPPAEHTSPEASSHRRRNFSISSVFRAASQVDSHSSEGHSASPIFHPTGLPSLAHKSSKSSLVRVAPEHTPSRGDGTSEYFRPRVLTKARPTTPQKPSPPPSHTVLPEPGDPLLLDDDPFARAKGVKMMQPRTRSSSTSGTPSSSPPSLHMSKEDSFSSEDGHVKIPGTPPPPVPKSPGDVLVTAVTPSLSIPEKAPPTPLTPDEYKVARQQRRGQWLEKVPPSAVADAVAKQLAMNQESEEEQPREPTPLPPTYFPIVAFMSDATLLPVILSYLSYSEWLALYSSSKQVQQLFQSRILREFVLERFLSTVGYSKWGYEWAEPTALSLRASSIPPPRFIHTDMICRISTTIYEAWRCQHISMLDFPLRTCNLN